MKRILIALFLVFSLLICLTGCPENAIEENPDFATYNELFNKNFENYTINLTVTGASGDVINEEYVVTTNNGVRSISYTIERLNQFNIDGDLIGMPENYVSVTTGEYTPDESASKGFDVPKFNFSYKCLNNKEVSFSNSYSTGITSLNGFMGWDIETNEANVRLVFEENIVSYITVSFISSSNNTVDITYTFN